MRFKVCVFLFVSAQFFVLPAIAEDLAKQCDLLAASPLDKDKPTDIPGVPRGDIDKAKALPACEAAVAQNPDDARLIFELARILDATNSDAVRAAQLYQQAADKGWAVAMVNLGSLYEDGNGVKSDLAAAAKWYLAAAEKGNPVGQTNLGILYQNGTGVPKDYAKALEWFLKADAQNYTSATLNIGQIYENGWSVPEDFAKAAEFYQKAADGGEALGFNNLGNLYEHGRGVPKDLNKAAELY